MASTTILRAVVSFTFVGPTGPVSVRRGSTYHKDSPRLQGLSAEALEKNFIPFEPDFGRGGDSDIEQATAAPGEKRNAPRRKKAEEPKEAAKATAAPGETEEKPAPESETKE